jgi:hypothetical protein
MIFCFSSPKLVMKLFLAFVIGMFTGNATAVTIMKRKLVPGPEAKIEVIRYKLRSHYSLYSVHVTPPSKNDSYFPGDITVYLDRKCPDCMRVKLASTQNQDGSMDVSFSISPEKEALYSIAIRDYQSNNGKIFILFDKNLRRIEKKSENASDMKLLDEPK